MLNNYQRREKVDPYFKGFIGPEKPLKLKWKILNQ